MAKFINVLIITVFVAVFWHCNTKENNQAVLATVNDFAITESEFVERYSNFLFSTGVEDNLLARRQMVDNMISEILLLKVEDNRDVLQDPEFMLKKEQIWKEVLLAFYKEKEVYQKIEVSEEELREEFVRVNEQISARHLYARNKKEADQLYTQLINGFTFEQLAPLVFSDEKLATNGGYLGYFGWGDMDPDFEAAAFSMKVDEISKPVRTAYGYSIIKVEDRFRNPILTEAEFNRKKESLLRLVRIRKSSQMKRDVTASIAEALDININEDALNTMMNIITTSDQQIKRSGFGTDDLTPEITVLTHAGGGMTIDQAIEKIQKLPASTRSKIRSIDHLRAALRGIVVQEELINRSVDNGYDENEQFLKKYERWVAVNLIEEKYQQIYQTIDIPEEDLITYYQTHQKEFVREAQIQVQDIIVLSQSDADKIMNDLHDGKDFTKLAKAYSLRSDVEQTGGISPFVPLSRYGEFKDTFKNTPLNELIGPLPIKNYYMIARVIAWEEQRPLTFEEVRGGIQEVLRQEQQSRTVKAYLDNLRGQHTITVNQDRVASLPILKYN